MLSSGGRAVESGNVLIGDQTYFVPPFSWYLLSTACKMVLDQVEGIGEVTLVELKRRSNLLKKKVVVAGFPMVATKSYCNANVDFNNSLDIFLKKCDDPKSGAIKNMVITKKDSKTLRETTESVESSMRRLGGLDEIPVVEGEGITPYELQEVMMGTENYEPVEEESSSEESVRAPPQDKPKQPKSPSFSSSPSPRRSAFSKSRSSSRSRTSYCEETHPTLNPTPSPLHSSVCQQAQSPIRSPDYPSASPSRSPSRQRESSPAYSSVDEEGVTPLQLEPGCKAVPICLDAEPGCEQNPIALDEDSEEERGRSVTRRCGSESEELDDPVPLPVMKKRKRSQLEEDERLARQLQEAEEKRTGDYLWQMSEVIEAEKKAKKAKRCLKNKKKE